jgi:hypothetical protein
MTLTAAHTDEQIERVLATLERLGAKLGIIPDRPGNAEPELELELEVKRVG